MKKNGKKNMNHKGFSFVELLAAIVIIGILSFFAVTAVNRYIKQSKDVKNDENIKNIKMAAQMYLQANRSSLPKNIGENVIIEAKTLRDSNYLKEDITNAKGESCMQSSVRVYHYDRDEYSYYVNMACGNEEGLKDDDDDTIPAPSIGIKFYNDDKATKEVKTNDVNNVYFEANICGDDACDGSSKDEEQLGIYSYSYEIYAVYEKENKETEEKQQLVYNSGNLKGGLQTQLKIVSKRVSEYVNFSGFTMISVKITAVNEQGISYTETVASADYKDDIAPVCKTGNQEDEEESKYYPGEAINDNDWLNKNAYYNFINGKSYESTYRTDTVNNLKTEKFKNDHTFKITAYCDDGFGSGCIRNSFVRTWPNGDNSKNEQIKYQYGARWSSITIKDNANHATDCYVRANVDLKAPTVKVKVYKVNGNKGTLLKELSREFTNNEIEDNGNGDNYTISCANSEDKKNCPKDLVESSTKELWMNAANYPGGTLEIDIEMEDNLYLHDYTWELNDPYIGSGKSVGDPSLKNAKDEQGNSEIVQKVFAENNSDERVSSLDGDNVEHSRLTAKVEGLKINREGKRYGKFTACDKAGNCTTVNFYFNIDITPPPVPEPKYELQNTKKNYEPDSICGSVAPNDNWTNQNVVAYIPEKWIRDDVTKSGKTAELSGHDHYNYWYYTQNKNNYNCSSSSKQKEGILTKDKINSHPYSFLISDEGNQHIIYNSCDKAGNCSNKTSVKYVKIDKEAPTCVTTSSASGWTNQDVTVTGTCTSENEYYESGCVQDEYGKPKTVQETFRKSMNKNVGPGSNGDYGYVYDKAGNKAQCKKVNVKIDKNYPKCDIDREDNCHLTCGWSGCYNVCESVTYTISCSENNGVNSGCVTRPKIVTYNIRGSRSWFDSSDYEVKDNAGNITRCDGRRDEIIIEPKPTGGCSVSSDGTINADDNMKDNDSYSGTASKKYSVNNGSWTTNNKVQLPACSSGGESLPTVRAKIISNTGVESDPITCTNNYSLEDCCTDPKTTQGQCSAQCDGQATVYKTSKFDGRDCGSYQVQCNVGLCNGDVCKYRGNQIRYQDYNWTCTSGHTHTSGYWIYCLYSDGYYAKWGSQGRKYLPSGAEWKSPTQASLVCSYCGTDGCTDQWTVINDPYD